MVDFIETLDWPADELFALAAPAVDELQLPAARDKFHELVDRVPMLKVLAEKQGVTDIGTLNDLCPILFKHTAIKSYPMDILDQGRYDRLTAWLDKLTVHDLSSFDASTCQTIDEWLLKLEQETPMRLAHSTGTSGKVSFFPRSDQDTPILLKGFLKSFAGIRGEPRNDIFRDGKDMLFVWLGFRLGNSIPRFLMDEFARSVSGTEESNLALYPGAMSVDVISLNGRLRTAEAAGRLKDFRINPALLARRESLLAVQADRPNQLRNFVKTYAHTFADRQAIVLSTWSSYIELKDIANDLGVRHLFASGSLATGGGGAKGLVLPQGYEAQVKDFLGLGHLPQFYAMTETNCWMRSCSANAYHLPLQTIAFVLDPESGEPKPRSGRQTGRYAFFDLTAKTYWGGCVTGDEVTVEWEALCPCGRKGGHIVGTIQRYSDKLRGDDKITCSGAPKAHDDALNFLAGLDKKQVA